MILPRRLPGLLYTYRYSVYSILILASTFTYFLLKWNVICTNLQTWQYVSKMCKLYEQGRAVGSLCMPLCTTQDIHSLTCHSFKATKEAVFSAEWHNTRLVFKSTATNFQSIHWYDNGVLKYPTEKEFLTTIRSLVKKKLNLTISHDAAVRLSRLKPSFQETDKLKRQREMDNLWILLQDNEYILASLFSDRDIFPQLLGTCGPYFAVEYLDPVPSTSSLLTLSDSREDWGRRLKIAVQIFSFLEELEDSHRDQIYLCDMKLEHFGIAKGTNKLKYLDLNTVYPKSVLNKILKLTTDKCESDNDCDFFDCRSRCSRETRTCQGVTNNNLQIICEKIFLGWRMSNTVIVPGLLMSEHTPSQLATILRQCANPESEEGRARATPDPEIRKTLYNVVTEIEHSVNHDDDDDLL